MIGKRRLALIAAAIASAALLGSCEMIMSLFNKPPTVSVSAVTRGGDGKVWSAESIGVKATASDADDDTLTYQWYINDTLQEADEADIIYTAPMVSSEKSIRLSVTVSDGKDETTESVTIAIQPSGTLIVYNDTSTNVYNFYCVDHPEGLNGDWGDDILGDYMLPVEKYLKVVGLNVGKNLRWVYSSGTSGQRVTEDIFPAGQQRTLTLSTNQLLAASPTFSTMSSLVNASSAAPRLELRALR